MRCCIVSWGGLVFLNHTRFAVKFAEKETSGHKGTPLKPEASRYKERSVYQSGGPEYAAIRWLNKRPDPHYTLNYARESQS